MRATILESQEDTKRWSIIDSRAKEYRLGELFRLLNRDGTDAVVIKGWAVGRFYPLEHPRAYTDIDIAVSPEDYVRVCRLIRESNINFQVDLHSGLRTLDPNDWQVVYERSYSVPLDGVDIKVLADEDNLNVAATHWLTDGAINRERLFDIFYLVKNRRDDFDWDLCFESCGPVRSTWVISAILSAAKFLGLPIDSLPERVRSAKLPQWFQMTLQREWRLGVYPRIPLSMCLRQPSIILEQLQRRFPPNKIAATVEMELPIDKGGRSITQIRSAAKRGASLLRQISAGNKPS